MDCNLKKLEQCVQIHPPCLRKISEFNMVCFPLRKSLDCSNTVNYSFTYNFLTQKGKLPRDEVRLKYNFAIKMKS